MNVQYSEMIKETRGKKIVFIHVGKCAGGSAILSLNNALSNDFTMFEMHVYDSNRIIREVVNKDPEDAFYLILTRDPISRFISSFNWDKHNTFLRVANPGVHVRRWFEEFPSVNSLACSLSDPDVEKADRALEFTQYGHMGMGPAWYTPLDLLPCLPRNRTFVCETENFSDDLQRFASAVDPDLQGQQIQVFQDKSDFTAEYDKPDEIFSKTLADEGRRNLRILLNEDVRVWNALRNTFRHGGH